MSTVHFSQINSVMGYLNNAAAAYRRVTAHTVVPANLQSEFAEHLIAAGDALMKIKAHLKAQAATEPASVPATGSQALKPEGGQ